MSGLDICIYFNKIAIDNDVCNDCPEFMITCLPIIDSIDGYSSISECSNYFRSGCVQYDCLFNSLVNL